MIVFQQLCRFTERSRRIGSVFPQHNWIWATQMMIPYMTHTTFSELSLFNRYKYCPSFTKLKVLTSVPVFYYFQRNLWCKSTQNRLLVLQYALEKKLLHIFPNVTVALSTLELPVSVALAWRHFSKLKPTESYLMSTMRQEWLNGLAQIAAERETACLFDTVGRRGGNVGNTCSIKTKKNSTFRWVP